MWARGRARGKAAAIIIGCAAALGFGAAPAQAIGLDGWFGPGTVTEGTNATATFNAAVACGALEGGTSRTYDVDFVYGTATAADVGALSKSTVTIHCSTLGSDTGDSVSFPIVDDALHEADETLDVRLSQGGTEVTRTTLTIASDDAAPQATISNASGAENGANGKATFTVTIPESGVDASYHYTLAPGTASNADFNAAAHDIVIPAGTTVKTFEVPITDDLIDEYDETFTATITGNDADSAVAASPQNVGTGTITDDDVPAFSISQTTTPDEGDSGTTPMSFTIHRSIASTRTLQVRFSTANGTATAPADYAAQTNVVVTIAPGEGDKVVTVDAVGDVIDEPDEAFSVVLDDAGDNSIAVNTTPTVGVIVDDDVPQFTISQTSTPNEGDTGTTPIQFTIHRSIASTRTLSVQFSTGNGTATAPADYQSQTGVPVTFAPGDTDSVVTVDAVGDTVDEDNETFTVTLSRGADTSITVGGPATGTITDDDVPHFTISQTSTPNEGNTGTTPIQFTIHRSIASSRTLQVRYSTTDGTAVAPGDYTARTNTIVTIGPNEGDKVVTVDAVGDVIDEPNETFGVTLSAGADTSLTVDSTPVQGTITDDDVPHFTISQTSTPNEGDTGTTPIQFTIHRSIASTRMLSVVFSTGDGTATQPGDYTPRVAYLVTFAPGDTDQVVTVDAKGDTLDEADETFMLTLSRGSDTTITVGNTINGVIKDDDASPVSTITADPTSVPETGHATVTVALNAPSGRTVNVGYALGGGTATPGSDYDATAGTVSFAVGGPTTKTVDVPIAEDTTDEFDETFDVVPTAPDATSTAGAGTTLTILDDDAAPTATIGDATGAEADGFVVLPVTLSAASGKPITVSYTLGGGTATPGVDYDPTAGSVALAPGATGVALFVPVLADDLDEGDETFDATPATPDDHVVVATTPGHGTITNSAPAPPPPPVTTTTTTPPTTTGTATTPTQTRPTGPGPKATLGKISYRRGRATVKIGCPAGVRSCRVTVSLRSVADRKAKVKQWRKARTLGQRLLVVPGGRTASQTFRLSKTNLKLLNRAKKIRVRADAVAVDDAGRIGSSSISGTIKK